MQVETPGSAVLPIARFGSILRECTDDKLALETDGQGTLVRGERSEFNLPAENPDEFPTVAAFNEEKFHELAARLFREMIRRTVFATDNESSRYALGGVLLEMDGDKIIAVGTDGRRLAKMEGPAHERRRASNRRSNDDRAHPGHAPDRTGPHRRRRRNSDRRPRQRHSRSTARGPRSTRGWSKAAFPNGAMCSRAAPTWSKSS